MVTNPSLKVQGVTEAQLFSKTTSYPKKKKCFPKQPSPKTMVNLIILTSQEHSAFHGASYNGKHFLSVDASSFFV